jgi:citrate lyase beta subunit
MQKAWRTGADGIILDLEDAVGESEKAKARKIVGKALDVAPEERPCVFVRINSYSTSYWQDDVREVSGRNLHGIVLPKCQSEDEVLSLEKSLEVEEKAKGLASGSIRILLLIESARGVLQASGLAEVTDRVAALLFGAEDFALDMGILRAPQGTDLLYARSSLAICARAHGCLAIDSVYPNFQDTQGLMGETEASKRLGFTGKLAIHPKQVEPIHFAFAPSDQEVDEARKILDVFAEAEARGVSVAAFNGKVIDKPIVERARRLVALAESRR